MNNKDLEKWILYRIIFIDENKIESHPGRATNNSTHLELRMLTSTDQLATHVRPR